MGPPKNDNFSHFENTGYKKMFCCNPQIHQKLVFFNLSFLKDKNIDVEQTTQLR